MTFKGNQGRYALELLKKHCDGLTSFSVENKAKLFTKVKCNDFKNLY